MTEAETGNTLESALLVKTGVRKTSLKLAAETDGIVGKAAQKDLLPQLVIQQRATASLKIAAKRVRKSKPTLVPSDAIHARTLSARSIWPGLR